LNGRKDLETGEFEGGAQTVLAFFFCFRDLFDHQKTLTHSERGEKETKS
jgi:hypothetical protein